MIVSVVIISHILVCILSFLFFYFLIKKIIRSLFIHSNNLKQNPHQIFISFGISLLFFYNIIENTLYNIFNFIITPLWESRDLASKIGVNTINETVISSSFLIEYILSNLYSAINTYLLDIKLPSLAIFFIFWLTLALAINHFSNSSKNSNNNYNSLSDFFQLEIVKNLSTFLIFLFAIYLSISSIIAVPEFQTLENSKIESTHVGVFSNSLEEQRIYSLDDLTFHKDTIQKSYTEFFIIENLYSNIDRTIDEYNKWINRNWINDEKLQKYLINRYENVINQKIAAKERLIYKIQLSDWYLSKHEQWVINAANYQLPQLRSLNSKINSFLKDLPKVHVKVDSISQQKYLTNEAKNKIATYTLDLTNLTRGSYDFYDMKFEPESIPNRPSIGEKFGVFNIISGWLLKTESLSLALIVGLFGFGLLGSISSLFIRRRLQKKVSAPIIIFDIPGIIINGLSAAIVVFLAVKGSIIIFTDGESQLNPYVLFFICFIASVYSEDVWKWAKKKLDESLS